MLDGTAEIIFFPKRHHSRASAGSRAASVVRSLDVTPAATTRGVAKTRSHHSAGILSLCDHLRTADTPAPISSAIASAEGQRPMIDRNESVIGNIESALGHFVLNGKANVSRDCGELVRDNLGMGKGPTEAAQRQAFIDRVRLARMSRFKTQKPICVILELDQGNYKQYEVRTPLPYRFVPKFCAACGVSIEWLLTNEGEGPELKEAPPRKIRARKQRKGRRSA